MGEVAGRRMTVEIDGDFVVFLIGARFDMLHLARSLVDLGGRRGMKHMLDYLVARPEKGLLAYQLGIPTIVQYWRSFEQLEAFAKDRDDPHLDLWRKYWRRVGRTDRTGIWHETSGPRWRLRSHIRKHASAWPGQSGAPHPRLGVVKRSRSAGSAPRLRRTSTALHAIRKRSGPPRETATSTNQQPRRSAAEAPAGLPLSALGRSKRQTGFVAPLGQGGGEPVSSSGSASRPGARRLSGIS